MLKKEKTISANSKVKMYLQMPHILTVLIILSLSIVSILVSVVFKEGMPYLSSVFANIFAGLLTGLIICLISAVKSVSLYRIECQINWLERLREECCDYSQKHHKMLCEKNSFKNYEDYYDFIYDVLCEGNNININISQSVYDKTLSFNPNEYCKINFDFDARKNMDLNEELRDYIISSLDVSSVTASELRQRFSVMDMPLQELKRKVYNKISELKAREKAINLSIF